MSNAFDELERQLRRAVRRVNAPAPQLKRRYRARTLIVGVAGALALSAGALAATRVSGGPSAEDRGRQLAFLAVRDTARLPVCRQVNETFGRPRLTNAAPLKQITDLLPVLKTPASSANRARTLTQARRAAGSGGPLLTQTIRTIALRGGVRVLLYVQQGSSFEAVNDPAGCGRARAAQVAVLYRNHPTAVQRWARRRLAQMTDTVPGLQTLWTWVAIPGQQGMGGSGDPVRPGRRLHTGLRLVTNERDGDRVFVGVAGPRAARVVLRTSRARMRGYPLQTSVRDRFYALRLPKGVGPFRLFEVAADGSRLRSIDLRQ
jgi:hypothetical protein